MSQGSGAVTNLNRLLRLRASESPDLPLYTLRNLTTGEERETTDPGRAWLLHEEHFRPGR